MLFLGLARGGPLSDLRRLLLRRVGQGRSRPRTGLRLGTHRRLRLDRHRTRGRLDQVGPSGLRRVSPQPGSALRRGRAGADLAHDLVHLGMRAGEPEGTRSGTEILEPIEPRPIQVQQAPPGTLRQPGEYRGPLLVRHEALVHDLLAEAEPGGGLLCETGGGGGSRHRGGVGRDGEGLGRGRRVGRGESGRGGNVCVHVGIPPPSTASTDPHQAARGLPRLNAFVSRQLRSLPGVGPGAGFVPLLFQRVVGFSLVPRK